MKIVVLADDAAFETLKKTNSSALWVKVESIAAFTEYSDADAFFNLLPDAGMAKYPETIQPVFINSVVHIPDACQGIIRINGWNGFIENTCWEAAGLINEKALTVCSFLNKKIIETANEPGFISARIIAMIINEAFYAKAEDVSSEEAIDTAMKMGTHYPYGPFEWAKKIGVHNIYELLQVLSAKDKRYLPSPLLAQSITS